MTEKHSRRLTLSGCAGLLGIRTDLLYPHVLTIETSAIPPVVRARTPDRLPVVLSREEVAAILTHLAGVAHLFVMLLYGTGLRLEECLNLRVKDVDFDRHQIIVRQGKARRIERRCCRRRRGSR